MLVNLFLSYLSLSSLLILSTTLSCLLMYLSLSALILCSLALYFIFLLCIFLPLIAEAINTCEVNIGIFKKYNCSVSFTFAFSVISSHASFPDQISHSSCCYHAKLLNMIYHYCYIINY